MGDTLQKKRMKFKRSLLFIVTSVVLVIALISFGERRTDAADVFPRSIVDDVGRRIVLSQKPTRIFSTALAMDNIVLSLVEPERVVGVTRFAAVGPGSYVAPFVKPHMVQVDALSPELVIQARPDVVLVASWNDPDSVKQLRDLGLPVYTFARFESVQDGLDNIAKIGEITGEERRARGIIDAFHRELESIQTVVAGRSRPTVLLWNAWGSTAGLHTATDDVIHMAGGVNAARLYDIKGWVDIDRETVIAINPEVMITDSGKNFVDDVLNDPALQTVDAVRNQRVYAIDHTDALNDWVIKAIRQLAHYLHPGVFD